MTASEPSAPNHAATPDAGALDTPHPESDDANDTGAVGVRETPPSASVPPAPGLPGGFPVPAEPVVKPAVPPNPLPLGGPGQFGGGNGQPWLAFHASSSD